MPMSETDPQSSSKVSGTDVLRGPAPRGCPGVAMAITDASGRLPSDRGRSRSKRRPAETPFCGVRLLLLLTRFGYVAL